MCEREKEIGKLVQCKQLQSRGGVKLEFVQNSFDSIRKFAIRLIRKGKKYSKNSMKINSKFVRFDSTPTIGWNQIFQMLDLFEICLIRFENLQFNWFERWKIIQKIPSFSTSTPLQLYTLFGYVQGIKNTEALFSS